MLYWPITITLLRNFSGYNFFFKFFGDRHSPCIQHRCVTLLYGLINSERGKVKSKK